eukprot:11778928-Alexandrium_andersonii.AAC.1
MGLAVHPSMDSDSRRCCGHPALTRGPSAVALASWQHRQSVVGLASASRGRISHGPARRGAQRRQVPAQ